MALLKALVLTSAGLLSQVPAGDTVADWNTLANKPATFPPSAHSHPISEVTGLQGALDAKVAGPASAVSGQPALFDGTTGKLIRETTYAAFKASLAISAGDVSGLGYFATGTDAANLTGTLNPARIATNALAISQTNGLQTALDGKAALSHTHVIGDVSGLGTAATYNIGTSGATVPLLNGANTWGTTQFFGSVQMSGNLAATGSGFEIVTNSVDDADNKYVLVSSTSSSGNSARGAYAHFWGNESPNPGRASIVAGLSSTLNFFLGGGAAGTSLRFYNGTSVGADSGNLLICAGGDVSPARGAYIALFGVNAASDAGVLDLRAGTGGVIKFNNVAMSAFATSTDLANSTGVLPNARLSGSYSAVTAMTFSAYWQVQPAAAHAQCYMDIPTGNYVADIFARKGSTNRWILRLGDNDSELGSDSGTNFRLYRCSDAGSATQVLRIARNNGAFEFAVAPTVGGSSRWGDADLLDGFHGTHYNDLANSTGVLPDARLSGSYTGLTNLTMSGNLFVGGFLQYEGGSSVFDFRIGTSDGADDKQLRLAAANSVAATRAAFIRLGGNENAGIPGQIDLTPGTPGWIVLNGPWYAAKFYSSSVSFTFALTDMGAIISHGSTSAHAWTIPPNGTVAFPLGATINIYNGNSGIVTITRGSGVALYKNGVSGDLALSAGKFARIIKVDTNAWIADHPV